MYTYAETSNVLNIHGGGTGVCKKNAGQQKNAGQPSPLHPSESNVDHGHHECEERAKKKLEIANPPMTLILNIGRGGAGGLQPTL